MKPEPPSESLKRHRLPDSKAQMARWHRELENSSENHDPRIATETR
jgi:hypothetical protein